MELIRRKWRVITIVYLVLSYLVCIILLPKRTDLLTAAAILYIVVTLVLFIGTFVGIPGMLLHTFFKKEKAAMPFYQAAMAMGTSNTNIMAAYGLLLLKDFKPEEALSIFEKAKGTTSHFLLHKTLNGNIALCHWKMGDVEHAINDYLDMLYYPDLEPITDFSEDNLEEGTGKNANFYTQDFVTLAYLYSLIGKMDEAVYFSKVAMSIKGDYAPAYDNLGQFEYLAGHMDTAKDYFKQALDIRPEMNDSLFFMAKIYHEEGNDNEARSYMNRMNFDKLNGLSTITLEEAEALNKMIG